MGIGFSSVFSSWAPNSLDKNVDHLSQILNHLSLMFSTGIFAELLKVFNPVGTFLKINLWKHNYTIGSNADIRATKGSGITTSAFLQTRELQQGLGT